MTKSKTSKDNVGQPSAKQLRPRNNVWNWEKVNLLIHLYRQHECLWNNYIVEYKNKEKRTQAVEDICTQLRITKFDFGKKIHNLRNQFNAETKKLERRIEESGCGGQELDTNQFRSLWGHYESLLFLKDIIAPRPGYNSSSGICNYQEPRKIEFKYQEHSSDDDNTVIIADVGELDSDLTRAEDDAAAANESTAEDDSVFQFEESTPEEDVEMAEEVAAVDEFMTTQKRATHTDDVDQKYSPPTTMREVIITTLPTNKTKAGKTAYFTAVHHKQPIRNRLPKAERTSVKHKHLLQHRLATPQNSPPILQPSTQEVGVAESVVRSKQLSGPVAELGAASAEQTITSTQQQPIKRRLSNSFQNISMPARDQWDAFGEMVAAEFRNLNSDLSRKKLKRKIMQAMLEVGEADDGINLNIAKK